MSSYTQKNKTDGLLQRLGKALAKILINAPTLMKIMLYMAPVFLVMYFMSNIIYLIPGVMGGILYWTAVFYVFVGFNVSLRQLDRSRVIDQPFSIETLFAISLGALIWPALQKKRNF